MPISRAYGQIKQVRTRKNGWTVAKRKLFLDELAVSCNATQAARAAGMSKDSAKALKKRDGEFAQLWAAALEEGTEYLDELVLAHQLAQAPTGDNPDGKRAQPPATPFDPKLALDVLKHRRAQRPDGRTKRSGSYPTQAEVDVALMKQLNKVAAALARRKNKS